MKKFIVCLLLICTICLGCFALTACDKDTHEVSKIEFIKNVYYNPENLHGIPNCYWFRVWYPIEWAGWINKTISIRYKLSPSDEYREFDKGSIICQTFDTDKAGNNDLIPDTWIYIAQIFEHEPSSLYIQVVSVLRSPFSNQIVSEDELISAHFDLRGTQKYSKYEGDLGTHV